MSDELSIVKQLSLTGQIIQRLDAADVGGQDNNIESGIWEQFFGQESGREQYASKKDGDIPQGGINIAQAYDIVMRRIYNAAKKTFSGTWDNGGVLTYNARKAIEKVANEWLQAVSNIISAVPKEEETPVTTPSDTETGEKPADTSVTTPPDAETGEKPADTSVTTPPATETGNTPKDGEQGEKQLSEKAKSLKQKIDAYWGYIKFDLFDDVLSNSLSDKINNFNEIISEIEAGDETVKAELNDYINTILNKFNSLVKINKETLSDKYKDYKKSERMVNNKKSEYYKYKDENGVTQRFVINDLTGLREDLITISDGALKNKQFITKTYLFEQTGLDEIPEGMECSFDKDGNLIFKTEDNKVMTSEELKTYLKTVEETKKNAEIKEQAENQKTIINSDMKKIIMLVAKLESEKYEIFPRDAEPIINELSSLIKSVDGNHVFYLEKKILPEIQDEQYKKSIQNFVNSTKNALKSYSERLPELKRITVETGIDSRRIEQKEE